MTPETPPNRTATSIAVALVLLLAGILAIVGGFILHFFEKAGRLTVLPIPFAGRLVILAGLVLAIGGIVRGGVRLAVRVGIVTLAAGVVMLAFGYVKMDDPALRFYAPLGFFIALAGAGLIWGGRAYAQETAGDMLRPTDDVSERRDHD